MNVFRVVVLLAALPLLPLAAIAKSIDKSAAPLDEYFGTQKMSALGIRMRIGDLGRRYQAHTLADGDALHDALILENGLRAWNSRYPRDTWLPPTAFHLEQLYAELQLPEARTHATAMLHLVATTFGSTKYAHLSRLRLAQGFPPLGPQTTVMTTPAPGASALPDAGAAAAGSSSSTAVAPAASAPAASEPPASVPSSAASGAASHTPPSDR